MAQLPTRRNTRSIVLADPTREFEDIYDRMGQLINFAFADMAMGRMPDAPWIPAADVTETDDAYVIEVELPGVSKDQLNVEVNDRDVVVSGEIAEPEEREGRRRRKSRRTGRFEFRTTLPGDIDAENVSATLSDGVLTVRAPKSEAAKPRRVEVSG